MNEFAVLDDASKLTLSYLDLIETCLHVGWTANQEPQVVVETIHEQSIESLRVGLEDLFKSDQCQNAIEATKVYGAERIQTVGFGAVEDLDTLVKMGLLLGERVVLWDTIGSRILGGSWPSPVNKTVLAKVACDLLLHRELVRRGVLVVLPHPIVWSEEAREADEQLRALSKKCSFALGLTMALIANEAGLSLHPYTQSSFSKGNELSSKFTYEDGFYSRDSQLFHSALSVMFSNEKMDYLVEVSALKFFEIVDRNSDSKRKLRSFLMQNSRGMSHKQFEKEVKSCHEDLAKLIKSQNAEMRKYVAEGGEATSILLLASIVDFTSIVQCSIIGLAGILTRLCIAGRKWGTKPSENVLVQVFRQISEVGTGVSASMVESPLSGVDSDVDEDIVRLRREFNIQPWTEDRHQMLLNLPLDTSRKLLRSLTPDEIASAVNHRQYQEDYIGDYIGDLWRIDRNAFWLHVEQVFASPKGLLTYDGSEYIDVMCSRDLPESTWQVVVHSLLEGNRLHLEKPVIEYEREILIRIIVFQTELAGERVRNRRILCDWLRTLPSGEFAELKSFLCDAFSEGLPDWLEAVILQLGGEA